MQILSLRLEQVKSYRFLELAFAPGANVIAGHNGAGKSTILEAIGFALFDSLPYNQKDFVREGEKTATVVVTFVSSDDDRAYEVHRRCGSSNSYVISDPETELKICEGKADVQRFLRRHMGIDPGASLEKLFSDTVGVPQGTFTAAFHQRPSERKSIFDPLLQVDEYDTAWTRLREPLSLLRDDVQALDVKVAGLTGRLEQLPALETAVADRAKRLAALDEEQIKLDADVTEAKARRAEFEAANAEIRKLDGNLRTAEQSLAQTEARLEAAAAAVHEAKAAAETVRQHQTDHDAYLAAQDRRKALEALVERRRGLQTEQSELDKARSLAQSQLTRIADALAEVARAEEQLTTLAPLLAQQEQLDQDLAKAREENTLLASVRTEQQRLTDEVRRLQDRCSSLTSALAEKAVQETAQREILTAIDAGEEAVSRAQEQMAAWRTRAETIKQQNEMLTADAAATCPICRQPLTAEHRAEVLAENETRIAQMRDEYGEASRKVKAEKSRLDDLRRQQKEIDTALRRLPRADELEDAQRSLAATERDLAVVTARAQEMAGVGDRIASLEQTLRELGDPRRAAAVAQATASRRLQFESEQETAQDQLAGCESALTATQEALAGFTRLDDDMAESAEELERTAAGYQTVLAHAQLAVRLDDRTDALARLESAHAAERQQVADLAETLATARDSFDEAAFAVTIAREGELAGQLASIQTEARLLRETQDTEVQQLNALRAQAEELQDVQARRERLVRDHQVLEDLRAILRQAGPFITRTLIRQISENAARIFGELMQDFTRHLTWQEDYSIALDVEGNLRQFAQLSGGEQMSAALAVRLALLQELSSVDIAFFDEPTTNLDASRREALAQQILKLDGLRQLFVISHDDTFEQATDTLIRVERINGESHVTA